MKIALLGDVGLFGRNSISVNPSVFHRFAEIREALIQMDIVVANLETPLTNSEIVCGGKSAYIKGHPSDVEILNYLGIQYVNIANNHMFDYGRIGFEETICTLEEAGIGYFGANGKSIYIASNGIKAALHGYCCYSTHPVGIKKSKWNTFGIHPLEPDNMKQQIIMDRTQGWLSILSVHCGQEHVHFPSMDHMKLARDLASVGVYIYHGHHPHVLQGIEEVMGSLIAYSLGNFCFDDVYTKKSKEPLVSMTEENRKTMILLLNIKENFCTSWSIWPIYDDGNKLHIDINRGIEDDMHNWSYALHEDASLYTAKRDELLNAYLQLRKSRRDTKWYLKRLNIDSVKAILRTNASSMHYRRYMSIYR